MKLKKPTPFDFVLERLESLEPYTRPMFGCTGVYIDDKFVLVLRQKDTHREDNGVWLCTEAEHHDSLRKIFPKMRSIKMFDAGETNTQVLPEDDAGFEDAVERACQLVLKRDPRIGRIPKRKKPRTSKQSKTRKKSKVRSRS